MNAAIVSKRNSWILQYFVEQNWTRMQDMVTFIFQLSKCERKIQIYTAHQRENLLADKAISQYLC